MVDCWLFQRHVLSTAGTGGSGPSGPGGPGRVWIGSPKGRAPASSGTIGMNEACDFSVCVPVHRTETTETGDRGDISSWHWHCWFKLFKASRDSRNLSKWSKTPCSSDSCCSLRKFGSVSSSLMALISIPSMRSESLCVALRLAVLLLDSACHIAAVADQKFRKRRHCKSRPIKLTRLPRKRISPSCNSSSDMLRLWSVSSTFSKSLVDGKAICILSKSTLAPSDFSKATYPLRSSWPRISLGPIW